MSEICQLNNLTNIQSINLNLPKGVLPLNKNNDRLEGRIRQKVYKTINKFTVLKGRRKYDILLRKAFQIIFKNEVCYLGEMIETEKQTQTKTIMSVFVDIQIP